MRTTAELPAADTMREGSLKTYTGRTAAGIRTDHSRKPQNRNAQLGIDPIRFQTGLMHQNHQMLLNRQARNWNGMCQPKPKNNSWMQYLEIILILKLLLL